MNNSFVFAAPLIFGSTWFFMAVQSCEVRRLLLSFIGIVRIFVVISLLKVISSDQYTTISNTHNLQDQMISGNCDVPDISILYPVCSLV